MFVIFLLLWVIAILLIYANPKTIWAWWASSCLFLNGFGGIAVVLSDDIIPLVQHTNNAKLISLCLAGKGVANVLHHYVATYALIGFVLHLTNFLDFKFKIITKRIILALLAIPSIMMFILYPSFTPDYIVLSIWVVLYTLAASIILVISILKEKDHTKKYQKIFTGIFTIPTSLSIMWTSYLSVAAGYHEIWYLNIWIILFQFTIFIILALKYGVLGVRLRVERFDLDETIDTVINGMSIISHAIKNEASTINLCVDTIRRLETVNSDTDRKLSIIKESSKNLSDFTQRINKFRIYEIELEPVVLNILADKVISQVMPIASGKDIKITNRSKEDVTIMIDTVHVAEVLKNLLINAIESIEIEGTIDLETEFIDDKICLSVVDNGVGIPKEAIEKVLTPLYSTKKGKNNFGLGLSYCYKVMKCHNGSLKVNSKVNQGTTMSLFFPKEKVLRASNRAV
ncbi:MAG: sensor histidine kinase [Ruminiclostridium sp.]